MTSSRLPGKVLMTACDTPLLELMVERVKRMEHVDVIVVATTVNETDQPIVDLAERLGVDCFRGSEDDVLGRVLGAAQSVDADVIVELTGDCPLIDPGIGAEVISYYLQNDFDYVSNIHSPQNMGYLADGRSKAVFESYPIGNDVEVFSTINLSVADREAVTTEEREDVSPYLFTRSECSVGFVPAPKEFRRPDLRLTLDYESDYLRIRKIFESLYPANPEFTLEDILEIVDRNPSEYGLEGDVQQGAQNQRDVTTK